MSSSTSEQDFSAFYQRLDPSSRTRLDASSEKLWACAGDTLIHQGAPSDSVIIVEDGVVEVLLETALSKSTTPLTYLSRGDIVGELGVLNEKPRTATIRAVADVYYRRIATGSFLGLLHDLPGFGLYIAQRLAGRLAVTTSNLSYNSACVDLSGRLPNFDLIAILHTIELSQCRGELKIIDGNKEETGWFFIDSGKMRHARMAHLHGNEAVWELFSQAQQDAAFSFQRMDGPSRPSDAEGMIEIPISSILMQAAIKRDIFYDLPAGWQRLEGQLACTQNPFVWDDPETEEAARQIWSLLEREPQSLQSIWSRCNVARLTVAELALKMAKQGLVEYLSE